MSINRLKYLLLLLLLKSSLKAQVISGELNKLESDIISGKNPNLHFELTKLSNQTATKSNAILLAQYQTLLGDYYQSNSDISLALKYWEKSAMTIEKEYGKLSPLNALKYFNLSKYYSFLIKPDSALYFAEKVILICRANKVGIESIRFDKIYKQYGYCLKIKHITNNEVLEGTAIGREYLDSALLFNKRYAFKDVYKAKLYSDIGNTYTDEIIHFQRKGDITKAYLCLKKANEFYDKSILLIPEDFGKTNQLLSNIYFGKGLSYSYCFIDDSVNIALEYYHKGIEALTPNYVSKSELFAPNTKSQFLNESSLLVLLRFKIDALHILYLNTKKTKYLQACYEHSKVAFEVWETFFTNLKTEEIHLATEMYSAAPFGSSIPYSNDYYQITKDKKVAEDIFKWMDLNKYSVLLKQQLEDGHMTVKTSFLNISEIQSKLKAGQAIIEYYYWEGFNYAIITKDKFELYQLNLNYKINSKIDSLLIALKNHNAPQFCSNSKELHDLIFKPIKENLSQDIKELIIVPHDKLFNLPFEALVTNNSSTFKHANFLINHYQISYGLSCNLLFIDDKNTPGHFNSIRYINPSFEGALSLPFSNTLTTKLVDEFDSEQYNFQGDNKNSILHLATHAYCDYSNSRNSYLLLNHDLKLSLKELRSRISPMPLAVLSACETANGRIEQGEGVVNFTRQFYLAGVKSTITTLWKVDDKSTASILEQFYENLKQGKNSIASLHKAKLNYLLNSKSVDDIDPYYWSGIIYTGPQVLYDSNSTSKWIWYSLTLVCLLGAFLFFGKKFFRN
jgi:CHAT domain-containing protein